MGRYAGDIAAARSGVKDGLWAHAIARAQAATALITGASRQETALAPPPAGSLAARLDSYAAALTYGRTCCIPTLPPLLMAADGRCPTGRR